jgi:hypothetical protein
VLPAERFYYVYRSMMSVYHYFAMILAATLLLASIPGARGMAKWMTKEECGKQLRVGEFIMGSKSKASDKRTIKV